MELNQKALYRIIGRRIKDLRTQAHLTQGQLADAIGLLRTSVVNIEAGRQKAPLHVLYSICAKLGGEPRDILPSLTELEVPEVVPITIGGKTTEVPPRAAEMLSRLLGQK